MSLATAHSPTPEPNHPADPHATDAHHRQLVNDLIDLAATLARAHHAQAMAEIARQAAQTTSPPAPPSPEPGQPRQTPPRPAPRTNHTAAFERMFRAVRIGTLLARTLNDPAPSQAERAAQHRIAARKRIIRVVEDRLHEAGGEAEAIRSELIERLDGPDLEADIANRPTADIIAELLRDLGITSYSAKRRTPEDAAILHTMAAKPPQHPLPPAAPLQNEPAGPRAPKRHPLNSETADSQTLADLATTLLLHPTRFRGK